MSSAADQQLVQAAQVGDLAAFEELVNRHQRWAYNLAYRLMGSPEDAADALQDAFVKLYTRLPSFQGHSSFSTWLYRLVTNACLDALRRRRRQPMLFAETPEGGGDPAWHSSSWSGEDPPEVAALRQETREGVQTAISRLPVHFRAIVILKDIQGLSYPEIAELTGLPMGTVKTRIHRARLALSALLRESGADPGRSRFPAAVGTLAAASSQ